MPNDDSRRADSSDHLDARQCERLIGLACSTEKRPATDGSQPIRNADPNIVRAQRSSLAEAMISLILGPDAS